MGVAARFQSMRPGVGGWSAGFGQPVASHCAQSVTEVVALLHTAEELARCGRWVALALGYEAAPAFEPAFRVHATGEVPLAWALVFDRAVPASLPPAAEGAYRVSRWEPLVPAADYEAAIDRIHRYIAAGDTYQVNFTFPLQARFEGDDQAWFAALCRTQRAAYCAYLDLGRYRVLSASPELFFARRGNRLITRPMKGTLHRGRWSDEDEQFGRQLAACPKNRAENLMIVDLLRNDLGRIAVPGTVVVADLFQVERLETVLQMTSTIEAECRPGTGLVEILGALFPCGSITGAPKIRTMEIIHEVEPFPRLIYTGALGLLEPGGDMTFNVAIRTVLLDTATGVARFGVGGGITHDSTAASEYQECTLKARFLGESPVEFALIESILLEDGTYFLLERHLQRLRQSAAYFGFEAEPERVRRELDQVRAARPTGTWKVRLLLNRDGATTVEAQPIQMGQGPDPVPVALAAAPVDANDPFLYHKTTRRRTYEQAQRSRPDAADVLLWNERGEVTESCIANVVAEIDGAKYTPPVACGLLGGTFRAELLARGEIQERILAREDLARAAGLYLINSVRRWRRARLLP